MRAESSHISSFRPQMLIPFQQEDIWGFPYAILGSQMPSALQRGGAGHCLLLISTLGCLGPRKHQHVVQQGGLSFAPTLSWEAPHQLHFRDAHAHTQTAFPNSLHKCYSQVPSWVERTVQSHTSGVLPSSIKTKVRAHIWCNICLQENASSGRNAIELFWKLIYLAGQAQIKQEKIYCLGWLTYFGC